jgi:hypothetical protein
VIARPGGTIAGDLLLAVVGHEAGSRRNMVPPSGWTAVGNADRANAKEVRIHAWYRLAGSNEPSSYTFALTGGAGTDISGGILDLSGTSSTAPINASGSQGNGSAAVSVSAPSITTTVPNALLIFGGACNNDSAFTPPSGMTEQWDRASTGSTGRVGTDVATGALPNAGATGTRTATASTACRSVGIDIAVAPSS